MQLKDLKKGLYHFFVDGNADVAFYSNAYLQNNREWIGNRPLQFAFQLLMINLKYRLPHKFQVVKEWDLSKMRISLMFPRPKSYRLAASIVTYKYLVIDVLETLFLFAQNKEEIFRQIEEEKGLQGFYKWRHHYEKSAHTIDKIYELISGKLGETVTPELELELVEKNRMVNGYLQEAIEIATYNGVKIVATINSNYPKEYFQAWFEAYDIPVDEWMVCEKTKSAYKKTFCRFLKEKHVKGEEDIMVISSCFETVIRWAGHCKVKTTYYRSPIQLAECVPRPIVVSPFQKIYDSLLGIELFSGMFNHSINYVISYMILGPIVYQLLEEANQRAKEMQSDVIALCEETHIFVKLYKKFYGEITPILWSSLASYVPDSKEGWIKLFEEDTYLKSLSADQLANAFEFSFPEERLEDCMEEFAEAVLLHTKKRSKKRIKEYLQGYLGEKENALVINPIAGTFLGKSFIDEILQLDCYKEIEFMDFCRSMEKTSMQLQFINQALLMDTPALVGIFENEFSFVQPEFFTDKKKKIIEGAIEDYCIRMRELYENNPKLPRCQHEDMNAIIEFSDSMLCRLLEEE